MRSVRWVCGRVIADIDPQNTASVAVARKLGFRPAGEAPFDGRVVTRYVVEPVGLPGA
jgi:RimJ/RimL family protein N-acetyltransferase